MNLTALQGGRWIFFCPQIQQKTESWCETVSYRSACYKYLQSSSAQYISTLLSRHQISTSGGCPAPLSSPAKTEMSTFTRLDIFMAGRLGGQYDIMTATITRSIAMQSFRSCFDQWAMGCWVLNHLEMDSGVYTQTESQPNSEIC